MAKKSTKSLSDEGDDTLSQDFQATREIWNDGIENVSASVEELSAQLSQFTK
jgi:hypothetical protein